MIKLYILLIISIINTSFKPINYKYISPKIETIKILGERCSGTNFISALIERNLVFKDNLTDLGIYGHKHFIWWIGSGIEDRTISSMKGNGYYFDPKNFFFQNSEKNLFIIIIRNPYDWIRSWYLQPHHIDPSKKTSFVKFFSTPYKFYKSYDSDDVAYLEDYHPELKRGFENLFELRKYKYLNYEKLFTIVDNVCFVNYEQVLLNPEDFITFLAQTYSLEKKENFEEITTYKGSGKPFKPKLYFRVTTLDFKRINNLIDWDVEKRFGYSQLINN